MPNDLDLRVAERLTASEVEITHLAEQVGEHEGLIKEIKTKMDNLVGEVKQIRNALYFMAGAMGLNIPFKDIAKGLIGILSGHF